jgi:hypothetical protein
MTSNGSSYVGNITIGDPPQEFQVVFDTASGHVLLPHRACKSPACLEHRRYSKWESRTAADVGIDGNPVTSKDGTRDGVTVEFTQADFGAGRAKGVCVRDWVCLGAAGRGQACADASIVAAVSLDDVPFRAMPQDGIIGLGLEALSSGPLLSFFERLADNNKDMLPHFGISFGDLDGEIHFGAHDRARIATPLQWFPVLRPEDGFWQIGIQAVLVGNVTVNACREGCRAIIDTGASSLGVQAKALPELQAALVSSASTGGGCLGPDLSFDLGGMVLVLKPSDYATGHTCTPQLGSLDLEEPSFAGVYAFGEIVLRRYYAAFDWGSKRIGFARALRRLGGLGHKQRSRQGPVPDGEALFV